MRDIILILSEMMSEIHDTIMYGMGINMSDKELHFWIIGFIGLATFLIGFVVIKIIQKLKFSTTILSFLFTFVLMTVLVFAIEIQQAVTNSGNMEFADAVAGLWGFIVFFLVYAIIAGFFYSIFRLLSRKRRNRRPRNTPAPRPNKKRTVPERLVEEESPQISAEPERPIKYRSELRKQKENK